MAEASIPVDLFNPGQVFACLGFLEAAEILSRDAEARFDWSVPGDSRFVLIASVNGNPFATVIDFLAEAKVTAIAAATARSASKGSPGDSGGSNAAEETDEYAGNEETDDIVDEAGDSEDEPDETAGNVECQLTFPNGEYDPLAMPVRLEGHGTAGEILDHWADGSSRSSFKLYAGNRSAYSIICNLLQGKRARPGKSDKVGQLGTVGIAQLWTNRTREKTLMDPFGTLGSMGGSFNFDPRGAWTGIDAGYSPNRQKHLVRASPIVEVLAAWGLQHSRPLEYANRKVRYAVWNERLPPNLARPALAGAELPFAMRRFQFDLELSGKNKVVTFAREETV